MIDSHCHLASLPEAAASDLINHMRRHGVNGFICASARPGEWPLLARLARMHAGIYPAFGIHPWFCSDDAEASRKALPAWLEQGIAVGECGLDAMPDKPPMEIQRKTLAWQLDLAEAHGLPVILHCVRAVEPLWAMLHSRTRLRGVIHGFSGSLESAMRFVRQGLMIGLGPLVLNPAARRIRRVASELPAEALLLETDAPAPDGRMSDPGLLARVAARVAQLRGVSTEAVVKQSDANARRLFGLASQEESR